MGIRVAKYGATLLGLFCLSAGSGWASPIFIYTDSFENPGLAVKQVGVPFGWAVMGQADAWNAVPGAFLSIPDGSQVAYSNGGTLTRTIPTTLANDTSYDLSVDAGRRMDCPVCLTSFNPVIQLYAGSTLLATATGNTPDPGTWSTWTLNYTSGAADVNAGQFLSIVLGVGAADPQNDFIPQTNFDMVQLSATASLGPSIPEPATPTLFAAGVLVLIAWRLTSRRSSFSRISR
jgi:hypothetical protein